MTRSGRRPGTPATRETILAVARRLFAERGYDATTLRAIAEDAQVDPSLLIHYFGSKEKLFVAATGLPDSMPDMFASLASLPVPVAARMIVGGYLQLIDGDESRGAILALVRSAVANEKAAAMFREFVTSVMLSVVARLVGGPDAYLRASLITAQLVGIAMLRHVIGIEPIAKASHEEIIALVAPVVEQYLR